MIQAEAAGEVFTAKGKIVTESGWKAAYEHPVEDTEEEEEENDIKEQTLPEVKKGSVFAVDQIQITKGKTKPPAPFNEATLLSAMEHPVKYMETREKER